MTNETISTSEARTKLYSIVEQVGRHGCSFTLTKGGKPMAVLVSPEEVESWLETIEVLSDRNLMKQLKESAEDIKAGRVYSLEEVKKSLGLE